MSFHVRLLCKTKTYGKFDLPITITDDELCQHYLEEVLTRTAIFGKKCLTEWGTKSPTAKAWPHLYAFFKKQVKELEYYEAIGEQGNLYATANAATELKNGLEATMAAALSRANAEHALGLNKVKTGMNAQTEKLTKAMALMARANADKENRTPGSAATGSATKKRA